MKERRYEYVIAGDRRMSIPGCEKDKLYECLICLCGGSSDIEHAKRTLKNVLADEAITAKYQNIRIEKNFSDECWWND